MTLRKIIGVLLLICAIYLAHLTYSFLPLQPFSEKSSETILSIIAVIVGLGAFTAEPALKKSSLTVVALFWIISMVCAFGILGFASGYLTGSPKIIYGFSALVSIVGGIASFVPGESKLLQSNR